MAVFAWARRATRHFGDNWVPFVELDLRTSSSRWQLFSVQVDTGAVISTLKKSAAELLGVKLESGQPIDLAGIGSTPKRYWVHEIPARIGELPEFALRIAFSEGENVPNLLGRLDILDRLQIDLDASLGETRVFPPWLDAGMRRIWKFLIEIELAILAKWKDTLLGEPLDEVLKRFANRADQLAAAGAGLIKLHRSFELPLIIRSQFELAIQLEFILRDSTNRATSYLEFEHVTKHLSSQNWIKLQGIVGRGLRDSPMRLEGERRNRTNFDRVKENYLIKPGKPGIRRHWYVGSLRSLAVDLGRETEYDAIYGLYSAWAHGDSWTTGLLNVGHGGLLHLMAYWARILEAVAVAKKIILTADQYQVLDELRRGPVC